MRTAVRTLPSHYVLTSRTYAVQPTDLKQRAPSSKRREMHAYGGTASSEKIRGDSPGYCNTHLQLPHHYAQNVLHWQLSIVTLLRCWNILGIAASWGEECYCSGWCWPRVNDRLFTLTPDGRRPGNDSINTACCALLDRRRSATVRNAVLRVKVRTDEDSSPQMATGAWHSLAEFA
jgi:hypothetical protein